jgi:hypothetical protein
MQWSVCFTIKSYLTSPDHMPLWDSARHGLSFHMSLAPNTRA